MEAPDFSKYYAYIPALGILIGLVIFVNVIKSENQAQLYKVQMDNLEERYINRLRIADSTLRADRILVIECERQMELLESYNDDLNDTIKSLRFDIKTLQKELKFINGDW